MSLNELSNNVIEFIRLKYPFVLWVVDDHPYNRNIPLCKQHSTLLIRQKSTMFCQQSFEEYFHALLTRFSTTTASRPLSPLTTSPG